jgi:hypothetical protein
MLKTPARNIAATAAPSAAATFVPWYKLFSDDNGAMTGGVAPSSMVDEAEVVSAEIASSVMTERP